MLKRAEENYHLISPATSCGALPEGFAVAFSSVLVNTATDTYETKSGGKRGLHRHVLDRIASAAAVSWDSHRSRRIDDGRDPCYVIFCAVGRYRHFDGSGDRNLGHQGNGSPRRLGADRRQVRQGDRDAAVAHPGARGDEGALAGDRSDRDQAGIFAGRVEKAVRRRAGDVHGPDGTTPSSGASSR